MAECLISFGAHQVFAACTYSSLVWIGRQYRDSLQYQKLTPEGAPTTVNLQSVLNSVADHHFANVSYDNLSQDPWILADNTTSRVLTPLLRFDRTLGKVFRKMFQGIASSKDSVYFLRDAVRMGDVFEADSPELGRRVRIETNLVKPLLMGDQVHRYEPIKTKNIVLFPYWLVNEGNKAKLMTESELRDDFPLGWRYLKECEKILRGRERARLSNDDGWYRYIYPKNLTLFEKNKLLSPDISLGGNFSLDSNGEFYTTTTLYGYLKNNGVFESYEYWLAILNSSLLWFYLKNSGSVLANGYYRYKPAYLKNFPVPTVSPDQERVMAFLSNYLLAIKAISDTRGPKLIEKFLDDLIDSCVIELYFPDEIKSAGKDILKHLGDLKPITENMNDAEKLSVIQSEFNRLYDPNHPVRNHLETLDSVEEVRIIREALKK